MEPPIDRGVKEALANFLGFTMAKSKEIDSAIISNVTKQPRNVDALIHKVAQEVESKAATTVPPSYTPESAFNIPDLASILIPSPAQPPISSEAREQFNEALVSRDAPVERQPNPSQPEQLEFNFIEPNPQTKLILTEIEKLEAKINRLISLIPQKKK